MKTLHSSALNPGTPHCEVTEHTAHVHERDDESCGPWADSQRELSSISSSPALRRWLRISLQFFVELFLSAYILENQDCIQDRCIRWLQRQSVDFWSVHRRVTVNWDHKADPLLFHWTRCTLDFLELSNLGKYEHAVLCIGNS